MQHLGTKTLETDRLLLRQFVLDDAQWMYNNWAGDPEVTKFLTWPTHQSVEISRIVVTDWVGHYVRGDYYQWAIELKSLGQPIGSISVVRSNDLVGKAEIGYCIGRPWWHKGMMSEALDAVLCYLLDKVGYNRVEACHDPDNPHSGAVMAKCGMTCEGTQRQAGMNNQGLCDLCWYAVLSDDRKKFR